MDSKQKTLHWLAAGLLLVATVVAYWPSFSVPFYLDDFQHLVASDRLHDATDLKTIWSSHQSRFVSMWTLAVNYQLHGEDVLGYHLVNFAIHILAGLALWLLLATLLRSSNVSLINQPLFAWLPILVVAIFLLHPLQTQAVTYIIQRNTSLAGMFYLFSLAAYARARVHSDHKWLILSAVSGLLALYSKQTAATLPFAIILLDLLFFRRLTSSVVAAVATTALGSFALVTWALHWPVFDIVGLTRETNEISRLDYLATQFGILWHYVGLFFLIDEQRLEHHAPIIAMNWQMNVVIPALLHGAVISLGFLSWRRFPLIAFGILLFYIAHLVESSVIPIRDVAFEHRTYLPNAALALVITATILHILQASLKKRHLLVPPIAIMGLLFLSIQTYDRNTLWSDRLQFLKADAAHEPRSLRALTNLGGYLNHQHQFARALDIFREAEDLAQSRSSGSSVPPTIMIGQMIALYNLEEYSLMFEVARKIDLDTLDDELRFQLHNMLGRTFFALENFPHARAHLTEAASLQPQTGVISMLAHTELLLGRPSAALDLALRVLEVSPEEPRARALVDQLQGVAD